ncbi:MAG: hypothetical protein INH41_07450 [Myxococcaceae bacterium]|nr:hypothetical protein [Myxococcaceae bacterium]MCA3012220.1 hypothetical protein [Myxococcaceae bacterium]
MRRLLPMVLAVFGPACTPDNVLGGSLGEVIDLTVTEVVALRNPEALQLVFLRNRGVFLDIVIRVTVSLETRDDTGARTAVDLEPGARVLLQGDWSPGNPRTTVAHAPGGEPTRNLPRVRSGDLVISRGGRAGALTSGRFSMRFEETGGDLGFGRTLNSNFVAGQTRDAGFGDLP